MRYLGNYGNTQGCPEAQICTRFLKESLIKTEPARCFITSRHMPSTTNFRANSGTIAGLQPHIWTSLQFWLLDPPPKSVSLFQDPQGKPTVRVQEERAKPGATKCLVLRDQGEGKEGNRPRGPCRPTLLCRLHPYLEKQKGGYRTNSVFFRHFRNSFSLQL